MALFCIVEAAKAVARRLILTEIDYEVAEEEDQTPMPLLQNGKIVAVKIQIKILTV